MNIFKKLFGKKKKVKEENKAECWYNNAHEKGEAIKGSGSMDVNSYGSGSGYDCSVTKSIANH